MLLVKPVVKNENKEDGYESIDVSRTSISDLLFKAKCIQDKCHDYKVSGVSLYNMKYKKGILSFFDDERNLLHYPMSRHAFSQFSNKLGIPINYLQKCIDSGKFYLVSENMNSWINDYEKDLFIREYNGHIRGILSSKYSVCDTPDILKVLQDVVDLDHYEV